MKKKLSLVMVALVAIAAFATTMSLTMAKRAVSELTVVSEATTWDFSQLTINTSSPNYNSSDDAIKLSGETTPSNTTEFVYSEYEGEGKDYVAASTFKADAIAFKGQYPIRKNKFAQNGTLHFKTSVAGKIVVKFSDTGSSASATAVKRYLLVNGEQTKYWTSRENNGTENPYPAQLNVTTDEIEVPVGDVIIEGTSAIVVSYISFTPNTEPEPAVDKSYTLTFKDSGSDSDATADLSSEGSIEVSKILGEEEAAYVSSVSNATKVYLARTGRGLKLGTSSVAGTFTLNLATAVKPTSIVVKARKYSDTQYTIKINGNDFTLSADAGDDCTINYDGNTEVSSIAIEAGNKRAYVISVTVNYKEAGGDEPAGPATLIDYPTSQDGITVGGTSEITTVKIHTNTDNVAAIKFANGYTSSGAVNDNKAKIVVDGGFKAGDKITIAGVFNNSDDSKGSAVDIFTIDTDNKPVVLFKTQQFINGKSSADDPTAEEFTLEADADELYLGRSSVSNATATYVILLTVTRPGSDEPAVADFVYDFAAAAAANENPNNFNGNQDNGQGFYGWETAEKTDSRRNDYKGYVWSAGSVLPTECHVYRRGDRINGNVAGNGGLKCPNDKEMAIDGLTPGSKVVIEYDATNAAEGSKEIVWATGDGSSEGMSYRAAATINDADAVSGETAIPSGTEILVTKVTPAVKGTGYIVVKVKKGMVITKISIWQNKDAVSYNVNIAEGIQNGEIKVTRPVAYEGDEVNVIATPASAKYVLESISAKMGENAIEIVDGNFIMPAGDVLVSATFISPYVPTATIAALKQMADGDNFEYTGEAQVVAQARSGSDIYSYIKDASGSALIFDAGGEKTPAEAVGKTLAKDWVGSVSIVNNLFELVPTAALTLTEGEAQEVKYPVVDFSYVTAEHANEVVMLSGVTFSFTNNEDLVITKGESQLPALNKFALNPGFAKKDVEYNIVGAVSVNGDKVEFWPIEFVEKPTMDIVIEPAAGTDIAEALAKASEGIFVKDITINLEAEKLYTLSAPIYAPASITINGNGSSIDAIGVQGAFINFGAVPANVAEPAAAGAPLYAPASPVDGYTYVDNVIISNVTINGLKGSLYYDNKEKLCIENFAINNSLVNLEPENVNYESVIALEGGCAKNFSVVNSTFVGTGEGVKYFQRFNNGADFVKAGYEDAAVVYMNNTFVKVLKSDGQWGNNLRYNNNYSKITLDISNNIWYECGNGKILQRLLNKNFDQFKAGSSMANNTFWSENATVDQGNYGNGSDLTGNPYFLKFWKNQVEDDDMWFAVDVQSQQATAGAGDLRWGTWAPTHYNIAVSEEALQCADITVQATALDGEVVKVKVEEKKGFKLKELIVKVGAQTTLVVTDNSFVMPPANVSVDATFDKVAADYEIEVPTGTDIAAALDGLVVRNLKLTLAENGAYTLSKSIDFSGDLEILGKGATIDASGLAAPFINLNATPAVDPIVETTTDETTGETTETIKSYPIGAITVKDVTIKGLSQQLVKSNNLYLVNALTVENSVVEIKGAVKKSIFDFSGPNGNVIALVVNNSTLYADATTEWANGGFFSNQSGKKHSELGINTEAEGFEVLTAIQNSTLFNIANGRTTSTLRENSKPFMKYAVKNSIIVNSGKNGQFLKGLNSGQAGNDANWDVDGNLFNFDGAVAQEAVNNPENIKNSVDATVAFADTEAGIFNLTYVKNPRIAEWPAVGDPRWTAAAGATAYAINVDETIVNGAVTPSATWSLADETIKLTVTPAEGYELETLTAKIGATEIEIAEDKSFIMPAADVTISATFAAVPKLYIIGGPKEWKLDDMTELTYNLETQTYEFEYKPETTAYFAIADKQFTAEEAAAENAWDVFNANNRYALAEGDTQIDLEVTKPLVKVNGTLVLYAGTYKISITKDMQMTVIGERAPEPTEDVYIIAGSSAELLGTTWDGTNEANKLELNASTGLYEKTYEGVTLTAGTIEFKIVKNGSTWIPDGMGNNHTCEIPADGVYTVKVTFNTANPDKADDYEMVATPATGINAVTVDKLQNAVIYTLQGVRVEKARKGGVYIVNGKKVAIK